MTTVAPPPGFRVWGFKGLGFLNRGAVLLTDLNRVSLGGGYNMVSFWQLLQLLYYRVCWGEIMVSFWQ